MLVKLITKAPAIRNSVGEVVGKGKKTSRIVHSEKILLPKDTFNVIKQTPLTKLLNVFASSFVSVKGPGDVLVKNVKADVSVKKAGFAKIVGAQDISIWKSKRAYAYGNHNVLIQDSQKTSIAAGNSGNATVTGTKDGSGIVKYNKETGEAKFNSVDGISIENGKGEASYNKRRGFAVCNGEDIARGNGLEDFTLSSGSVKNQFDA